MATQPSIDLGWTASVPDMERWLAGAEPGEQMVYARGAAIPRHAPAWAHAAELAQQGEVRTHQRRCADGRQFDYFMVRRAAQVEAAPVVAAVACTAEEEDEAFRVLRRLRRAANLGQHCPTNAEIARSCGLKDASRASYRVRQLVGEGRIRVEQQGLGAPRVITIVGSGKSTARRMG